MMGDVISHWHTLEKEGPNGLRKTECCSPYPSVFWWDTSVILLLRGRYEILWHPAGCLEQSFSSKIQLSELRDSENSVFASKASPPLWTQRGPLAGGRE